MEQAPIEQLLPLVRSVAIKVAKRIGFSHDIDDLYQEGCVAVLEAHKTYDASRGASLKTWAIFKAEMRMLDFLREMDHLSRGHRKSLKEAGVELENQPQQPSSLDELEAHRWLAAEYDDYDEVLNRLVLAEFEIYARAQDWWRGHLPVVFELKMAGWSQVAISKVCGVTESRITQLVRKLHQEAEKWGMLDDKAEARARQDAQPGYIV